MVWRIVRLVIVMDKHQHWTLTSLLLLTSYTNVVDGGLQAWFERLLREGVLQLWDVPVLAAEWNFEDHGAQNETFCLIICKMNIEVNIPGYNNELYEVHIKHMTIVLDSTQIMLNVTLGGGGEGREEMGRIRLGCKRRVSVRS